MSLQPVPSNRERAVDENGFFGRVWYRWLELVRETMLQRQAARAAVTGLAAGARTNVTVTWPKAYPDTNYSAVATVEDPSALGTGLRVERIRAKSTTGLTVQVINDSAGALSGTVDAIAVHD